ncbi:MAG: CPBP family glutamic-type intramembrane protease, partial [Candidatus Polarisedimenticolia bacterium]
GPGVPRELAAARRDGASMAMSARRPAPTWVHLLELGLFLMVVFSFIWIWSRRPHAIQIVYVLGLGLSLSAHWRHRERLADLGLRLDNLGPALRDAAIPTVPLVSFFLLRAWWTGHWSPEALDPERFGALLVWGFFQQYLLQAYIHRRLAAVIERPLVCELAVAAVFAALHLPNPVLVPVTFLAGFVFSVLFRRHPNLFVLALCHALGSTAVAFAFDPEVLHRMRVGPGYFLL